MPLVDILLSRPTRPRVEGKGTKLNARPERVKLDKVSYLVEKKPAVPDTPQIENRTKLVEGKLENDAWVVIFLSRNPHYKFLYLHRCSWSNMRKQFVMLNVETGERVVMTYEELIQKIERKIRTIGGFKFEPTKFESEQKTQ